MSEQLRAHTHKHTHTHTHTQRLTWVAEHIWGPGRAGWQPSTLLRSPPGNSGDLPPQTDFGIGTLAPFC